MSVTLSLSICKAALPSTRLALSAWVIQSHRRLAADTIFAVFSAIPKGHIYPIKFPLLLVSDYVFTVTANIVYPM